MKCWLCHEININVYQAAVPTYKLISAVWSRQGQCNLSASIKEWDNRSGRQSKSNMASSWQCLIIFELKRFVTCRQEGHGDYKQCFREMMEGNGEERMKLCRIWQSEEITFFWHISMALQSISYMFIFPLPFISVQVIMGNGDGELSFNVELREK